MHLMVSYSLAQLEVSDSEAIQYILGCYINFRTTQLITWLTEIILHVQPVHFSQELQQL